MKVIKKMNKSFGSLNKEQSGNSVYKSADSTLMTVIKLFSAGKKCLFLTLKNNLLLFLSLVDLELFG